MDNLRYLENLGWSTWSTPYSRDKPFTSFHSLRIINDRITSFSALARPTVAVVGEQGCGKTSVLESLIGTGFLPKKFKTADGDAKGGEVKKMMQTRCPVVINLVKVSSVAECRHTCWVEFDHHNPTRQILDFDEVEAEIEQRMELLSSQSANGVSEVEIVLTFYSSEVLSMTLIDLPGLTLEQSTGEWEKGEAHNLILKYVREPDVVILAVASAPSYVAAPSRILDFVRKVDPFEKRSFVVVSHWDKLPTLFQGRKMILGKCERLDLGLVGIQNRTEEQLFRGTSVQDSQVEAQHFLLHNYEGLITVLTGVGVGSRYLVERVCEVIIFLWGSQFEEHESVKRTVLREIKAKIKKMKVLIVKLSKKKFLDTSQLKRKIRELEYVATIFDKGWKDFGIEGSATKHKQLSEQFLT